MLTNIKNIIRKKPLYILSLVVLVVIISLALVAPFLPFDPNQTDISNMLQGPSKDHLFGTDELGRDYFIRVLYGGRVSLTVGIVTMIMSTLIGSIVGFLAGYKGGILDSILMRIIDIVSSVPSLVLSIVLASFLKPGLGTIVIIISFFSWMSVARLVRAETLSYKERDYVKYGEFLGLSPFQIVLRHIFPQVFPTIIVSTTSTIASAIMMESTLSFLGLGIQPPDSSWGSLLQNAQTYLQNSPHMAILPGLLILLTILSFNELGNLIRDAYRLEA